MTDIPLVHPRPDIETFIGVIRGEIMPSRPPLVELFLDFEVEREIFNSFIGGEYHTPTGKTSDDQAYLKDRIELHYRLGYDYLRLSGGLSFPSKVRYANDTAVATRGKRTWAEEGVGIISSWSDFEQYPWPDPGKSDLSLYEFAAENLPEGMGLFVCPTSGFLEIPLDVLLGYENLCYLSYDNPELVRAIFQRAGEIILGLYKRLIGLPNLYGFFQGDDMGFKTATLVSPNFLRQHVLPWHKRLAALAHENGLIYLLHCCGNIEEIMPDLLHDVRIDGRHSFEDEGNSVQHFKKRYGHTTSVLGGIDVDKMCRLPEDQLRAHTRKVIEECLPGGRFALGSGNTVCNYIPISNYLAMVHEAINFA